ncbi:MAG: hypothetical protein AAFO95_20615, partial [Cyanobacteria bacterium J06600_6]
FFLFVLIYLRIFRQPTNDSSALQEKIVKYELLSKIQAIGHNSKPMNKYSIRPTKAILRILYTFGMIYWFVVFLNKVIDM